MTAPPPEPEDALIEPDIAQLQALLDQVSQPLQPLDVSALDGFLCGLLLQPHGVDSGLWLPCITDVEGRPLPASLDPRPLHSLVLRRHAQLQRAIASRQRFDPWVFEMEGQASPSECVLPWVAGFAAAMERFPGLMQADDARVLEPLALIYMHFAASDLEDAETLMQTIDTLEPPSDLAEAVQDIVRSVMLLADVTRPLSSTRQPVSGRKRRR